MIYAATGHRPDKLGGYNRLTHLRLEGLARDYLLKNKPKLVISGMALGWDQAWALAAHKLNIPIIAAIPCDNMYSKWPEKSQEIFLEILSFCKEIVNVSPGPYAAWKMQKRNEWMVDNCDKLIALYNGSKGGTNNCVAYARTEKRTIVNLWDTYNGVVI